MSEIGNAVCNFINERGKNGPDMTHGLKKLGNGDMQNGLVRIAKFFLNEGTERGYRQGEKDGIIKGTVGTIIFSSIVAGGFYVADMYNKRKELKKHEEEGRIILKTLKESVPEEGLVDEMVEVETV